ncbi:complement factor B-like [Ptychodera flava]|uniref:complement factor B-like n=1 Tax=Ptychodera flava TaxID=63121 RepID=UPI003969CF52
MVLKYDTSCARWTDSLARLVEERSPSVSYPVSVGQTVELTCNDTGSTNGRTLFGGVGPVCQDDGTWYPRVSDFSCAGGCVLPDFPSDVLCYLGESETSCEGTSVSVDTELDSGEIFSVSCDQGFLPKYNAGYVCVYLGPGPGFTVNPTLGDDACQAACADPGNPALGIRSPPPRGNGYYEPGDVVDFTCKVDTTQSGYTSLTCQSDGQWYLGSTVVSRDRLPPDKCFLNCMDLGTPKNGRKLGEDKNHRDSISFACNSGFRLIGSKTVTCDNGTWSDESPTCAKCSRNSGSIFIAIVFLLFYSEV